MLAISDPNAPTIIFGRCGFRNSIHDPLIERSSGTFCGFIGHGVHLGIQSERKATRVRLLGLDPLLGAELQIVIDAVFERILQFSHRPCRKMNHIGDIGNTAMKGGVVLFPPNIGHKSSIALHGLTPACSKNSHRATIAPLSVVGRGCGRWKVATSPFRRTRIRDPRPSETSAPIATSIRSISCHRMSLATGLRNSLVRVRLFFEFMTLLAKGIDHKWSFGVARHALDPALRYQFMIPLLDCQRRRAAA